MRRPSVQSVTAVGYHTHQAGPYAPFEDLAQHGTRGYPVGEYQSESSMERHTIKQGVS